MEKVILSNIVNHFYFRIKEIAQNSSIETTTFD